MQILVARERAELEQPFPPAWLDVIEGSGTLRECVCVCVCVTALNSLEKMRVSVAHELKVISGYLVWPQ